LIDAGIVLIYDLKQLHCFAVLGEELHFGRAAKRLNMTQPPLSRQIQMLEHTLKVQLLLRTSRSVRLTPAGRAFLPDARRILALTESAASAAQRISKGESGLIRMGFTAGSSYSFLPRLLTHVKTELKGVSMVLNEMVTMQQMEALLDNRIDFGLVRPPVDQRGLEAMCVASEPIVLAVSSHHRFASGPAPAMKDLAGEPFITFSPVEGRYFYELIEGMFRKANTSARYVQHISQVHSILALVSAGIGVALVPESAKKLHFEGAVLRELSGPQIFAQLFLVWRRENDNPALPAFRDLALQCFGIPSPPQKAGSVD
jgi:DNA-binding transcriptional LysR family regulator